MTQETELPLDEAVIRALLVDQAPQWGNLPLCRLSSSGTDNALFRLGADLLVRVPMRESAIPLATKELDWLPRLGGLPLDVPTLRFRGHRLCGMGGEFGVFDWIEGDIASPENIADAAEAAVCLAAFLKALQGKGTDGAPGAGLLNSRRGVPLADLSDVTLAAIDVVADEVDAVAALKLWKTAASVQHSGPSVWLHGDLKADNLIARQGKLSAVIDWGLSAVGDPAADYAAAWSWVDPSARRTFRDALGLSGSDWLRAKGWALYGAVIALSYYRGGKNEQLCRQSRLTLSRLDLML